MRLKHRDGKQHRKKITRCKHPKLLLGSYYFWGFEGGYYNRSIHSATCPDCKTTVYFVNDPYGNPIYQCENYRDALAHAEFESQEEQDAYRVAIGKHLNALKRKGR